MLELPSEGPLSGTEGPNVPHFFVGDEPKRLDVVQTSLFLGIRPRLKLYPRVEFTNVAFQFQRRCWEKRDITVRPARPVFICVSMVCSLFIVYLQTFLL
jgi:hypothetical protein